MNELNALIATAANAITHADALVITAGAGMGVDSGLPDFRGNEGFWRAYPALARAGLKFSSVATPATFLNDPALAWGFYGHRLQLYRNTEPHAGFDILKKWADTKSFGARIFTSNVDGQFQKAGWAEHAVRECHGSIHFMQCMEACTDNEWSADDFHPEVDEAQCRLLNSPPACPHCGGMARPAILMFNDYGWLGNRMAAQRAQEEAWLERVLQARAKVVVIELGAGTAIPSVRNFGERLISSSGAQFIRINVREPKVPAGSAIGLGLGAQDALQRIALQVTPTHCHD